MRSSRSVRSESGAVAVIFAIIVPLLLLPMGAIVVDIGFWYRNAKHAQTTADAAALAASAQITNDPATTSLGGQYVTLNMSDVTTSVADDVPLVGCPAVPSGSYCVEYPYIPDSGPNMGVPQVDEVEVTVTHDAPTFFGRLFGMFGIESTRRAVAEQFEIPGDLAIYVNSQDCDPGDSLIFSDSDIHITGWVHSQGGLEVEVAGNPQPDFTATKGTMREMPGVPINRACSYDIQPDPDSQTADFWTGSPTDFLPEPDPSMDWPVWYTPSDFGWYLAPIGSASPTRCRFRANKIEIENTQIKMLGPDSTFNYSGGVLPTGIYCGREIVEFKNSINLSGNITVLAEEIKTNAQDKQLNLTAYAGSPDAVLFFSVPNRTGWQAPPVPPASGVELTDDNQSSVACNHNKDITFNSGAGTSWHGLVFHPCGKVKINQADSTGSGSIVVKMLEVNSNGFDFTGDNNFSAVTELGLVE